MPASSAIIQPVINTSDIPAVHALHDVLICHASFALQATPSLILSLKGIPRVDRVECQACWHQTGTSRSVMAVAREPAAVI
jgi:hypothetical protein